MSNIIVLNNYFEMQTSLIRMFNVIVKRSFIYIFALNKMITVWSVLTFFGSFQQEYFRSWNIVFKNTMLNCNWLLHFFIPLTILTYVTKVERHFNTVHGQCGIILLYLQLFKELWELLYTVLTNTGWVYRQSNGYVASP